MGAARTVGAGAGEDAGCVALRRWTGLFRPSLARSIFSSFSICKEGFNEEDTLWRRHSHDG